MVRQEATVEDGWTGMLIGICVQEHLVLKLERQVENGHHMVTRRSIPLPCFTGAFRMVNDQSATRDNQYSISKICWRISGG